MSSSISLEGRTAVVTGAAAGLGRSKALALAARRRTGRPPTRRPAAPSTGVSSRSPRRTGRSPRRRSTRSSRRTSPTATRTVPSSPAASPTSTRTGRGCPPRRADYAPDSGSGSGSGSGSTSRRA
ncbi:hypothetical protein DVA86_09350 [Streptomyces armeniacus]|uniref:SDR family NAD(P)-dependent oxidoreductase n=1 Tax=Streptomyces armeniacus TaxID=83291 RepID=A0A345XMF9_9ACTN|nr:hypothetical protein DVA86_09350 [Streptomyces armeniacus]